jgi:hypothetical protein
MPPENPIDSSAEDDKPAEDQTSSEPVMKHIPVFDAAESPEANPPTRIEVKAEPAVLEPQPAVVIPIAVSEDTPENQDVAVLPVSVEAAAEDNQPVEPETAQANVNGIVTPVSAEVHIDNVNKSLWQYIKTKRLRELLVFVPVVVAWEIFIIVVFIKFLHQQGRSSNSGESNGFGYLLILPFLIFSYWFYKLKKQFEATFLEEFARTNNYAFDDSGRVDETYGTIFRVAGRQDVSDIVTGQYGNSALRLFLFELTVGSGKYQHHYRDTVIELDFHGQLPDLLMLNIHARSSQVNLAESFGVKNKVQLEGDFDQYFTLYAPHGNEVEALEVFSPDIMALMEDESKHYSVEFAGNRIYIYASGFVATSDNLNQLFELAKKLIDKIAPLASRLQNDSALVAAPVNLSQTRSSNRLDRKIILGITSGALALGIAGTLLAYVIQKPAPVQNAYSSSAVQDPTTYTADSLPPYCGARANSNTPLLTKQFLAAVISYNGARQPISSELQDNGKTLTSLVIEQQVNANQHFIAMLSDIKFPANASKDATSEINNLTQYDSVLAQTQQELPVIPPVATLAVSQALKNTDDSYILLRYDMKLPPSTCSFNEP